MPRAQEAQKRRFRDKKGICTCFQVFVRYAEIFQPEWQARLLLLQQLQVAC
jgi:hypothetical protein